MACRTTGTTLSPTTPTPSSIAATPRSGTPNGQVCGTAQCRFASNNRDCPFSGEADAGLDRRTIRISPLLSAWWFGQLDQLHIPADTVSTHWSTRLPIRPIKFSTTGHAFDQVVYGVSDEAGRVAEVVGQIGDSVTMMGESSTAQ